MDWTHVVALGVGATIGMVVMAWLTVGAKADTEADRAAALHAAREEGWKAGYDAGQTTAMLVEKRRRSGIAQKGADTRAKRRNVPDADGGL